MKRNPNAQVYSNNSAGELLSKENIKHAVIKNGEVIFLGEISLLGIGERHAMLHSSIPLSDNIGFFIDDRLWYPGDSFTNPEKPVEILALPVAGPWMKIAEAIDYALLLKPKVAFPVHDGVRIPTLHALPHRVLTSHRVAFIPMVEGETKEF